MTDKEKLEKVAAYLVRRMYAHNQMADIGSTGEIFDEKIENAKYEECRDTLNFIDSMQEEPQVKESAKIQHVNKTCKENSDSLTQEPVSEKFEKALAEEWKGYNERGAALVDALEDNTQELAFAKGFYRGANWQKQQILDCNTTLQRIFELGKQEMKQQMMAKAVNGTAMPNDAELWLESQNDLKEFAEGEEVKVIVIKKDEL